MSQTDIQLVCAVAAILIGCIAIMSALGAAGKKRYKNYRKEATERISNTSDIITWANLTEYCIHLHKEGRVCLSGLTDCSFANCPIRNNRFGGRPKNTK